MDTSIYSLPISHCNFADEVFYRFSSSSRFRGARAICPCRLPPMSSTPSSSCWLGHLRFVHTLFKGTMGYPQVVNFNTTFNLVPLLIPNSFEDKHRLGDSLFGELGWSPCLVLQSSTPFPLPLMHNSIDPPRLRPGQSAHAQVNLPIPLYPVKGPPAWLSLPIALCLVKLRHSSTFTYAYPSPLWFFFHSTHPAMQIISATLKGGFPSTDQVNTQDSPSHNTRPDNNQPKLAVFSPASPPVPLSRLLPRPPSINK